MKKCYLYSLLLVAFNLCSLFAQVDTLSEKDISEMSLEELMNVTVRSSSKIEIKQSDAPGIISVINRKQIDQFKWFSINDILYKQPGFGPAQDYDRSTVSSRGLYEGWNNNHMLLLIDGIPVNDNLYGAAFTSEITPLFMVKNIEITRGPGSALYGSYATNGLLQINTVSTDDLKKNGEVQFKVGSNGLQVLDVLAGAEGKNHEILVGFNSYHTDGNEYKSYDGSGRRDSLGNLQKFKTNDERKNQYFWAKIQGKEKFEGFSVQYHYQNWNFQTGHGWLWQIADMHEAMNESRHIVSFKYNSKPTKKLQKEFVSKFQKHNIDWNTRFYPNAALANYYPTGVWEYLNTSAQNIFNRAQLNYVFENKVSILGGIENDIFFYNGDKAHHSNIDMLTFAPFDSLNSSQALGAWLQPIKSHPVNNVGAYAQFTSGEMLGKMISITLGARYDIQTYQYQKNDSLKSIMSKTFDKFNPRMVVVFKPKDNLSIKALFGKAFRAPTPTETFGANTLSLGSNIDKLKPEEITTAELAIDWTILKVINWRINYFHTTAANQIAYSAANYNLSANIYTGTNHGLETELLFNPSKYFSGFVNYAYTQRISESIIDSTINASAKLTWDPAHKVNMGFSYNYKKFAMSPVAHYQGRVERRSSDNGVQALPLGVGTNLKMDDYRGSSVKPWFTLDLTTTFNITSNAMLGLTLTNVFDEKYYLVKNLGFPFDYKQPGRRFFASFKFSF